MNTFLVLKLRFLALLVLAFIVWKAGDFLAPLAAKEMTSRTILRTTQERDDRRVLRAFQHARERVRANAVLTTEPNPEQQIRDSELTLTASSRDEVLAARTQLVEEIQAAFASEGPGEFFDVGNSPKADPVPNHTSLLIRRSCQGAACVILLAALALLVSKWKYSGLPRGALWGILAAALSMMLFVLGKDGLGFWKILVLGLPALLCLLVFVLTQRVRRASTWSEGVATILRSKVEAQRHRHLGDTTKVRNLPSVEYEFDPGSGPLQGNRISLGHAPADRVDEVLNRYPAGAKVPVFYDPRNPGDCVLERNAPVSQGCLWGGVLLVTLVYEAVVLSLWNILSIHKIMEQAFPKIHHPLTVFITGGLGVFVIAAGLWNLLHPSKTAPWIPTTGTIVSSTVEAFEEELRSSSHAKSTFYQAVTEYRYKADGHDYHGSTASASASFKISSGEDSAKAAAARYAPGMEVAIYYNPNSPAQSSMNPRGEITLDGRRSLAVGLVLLAIACYVAMH